jgi:hypothetical protein
MEESLIGRLGKKIGSEDLKYEKKVFSDSRFVPRNE